MHKNQRLSIKIWIIRTPAVFKDLESFLELHVACVCNSKAGIMHVFIPLKIRYHVEMCGNKLHKKPYSPSDGYRSHANASYLRLISSSTRWWIRIKPILHAYYLRVYPQKALYHPYHFILGLIEFEQRWKWDSTESLYLKLTRACRIPGILLLLCR
jgi:hypothetical protein